MQSLISIHLTALLFMPACTIEPRMPWPLLFIDPISSKLTTTSGPIHLLSINGEFKQQKQRWQATLWLFHAGVWCCGWNPASSYQQSLHKLVRSGSFTNQTVFTLLFFYELSLILFNERSRCPAAVGRSHQAPWSGSWERRIREKEISEDRLSPVCTHPPSAHEQQSQHLCFTNPERLQ